MNIRDKLSSDNRDEIITTLNMLGVEFKIHGIFLDDIVIKDSESKHILFNELLKNDIKLYFNYREINNHSEFNTLVISNYIYIDKVPSKGGYIYKLL
jgi:hypothetical protein